MRCRRQHHVFARGRRSADWERALERQRVRRQRAVVVWLMVLALAAGLAWLGVTR